MKRNVIVVFFVFAFFLLVAETSLRLMGYSAFDPSSSKNSSHYAPYSPVIPHAYLGYFQLPGVFLHTLNDSLSYTITHGIDSLRITSFDNLGKEKPEIGLFGCSFTYGQGVDDTATFAWLLQLQLPSTRIRNFGVIGFGTVQSLLQLRQLETEQQLPQTVVINYASFHNERNTLPRWWRKKLVPSKGVLPERLLRKIAFCSAHINTNSELQVEQIPIESIYTELPLMRKSALVNCVDDFVNAIVKRFASKKDISLQVIDEINSICKKGGSRLVVAAIYGDENTQRFLSLCAQQQIDTVTIAVDLNKREFNNQPYDSHPNDNAHRVYAGKLLSKLSAH